MAPTSRARHAESDADNAKGGVPCAPSQAKGSENEGDSVPSNDSTPSCNVRVMGPTMKIVQLGAEEPEADQSSILCRQILAVLEQHHQETLQRLDELAAGRRLSHSSGNASLDPALDGANLDMHLDGSTEMGNDPFGTHMDLVEIPTSPPDNDVPGHGDGMSPDIHPGDSIPLHDSIPLWPPDALPQSDAATGTRVMRPTRKIVQLGAEEPDADQSSAFCRSDMHLDGVRTGLIEVQTSTPDNDVPGNGDGTSLNGEVEGVTEQGRSASKAHLQGDGNDSEESHDRRRRLSTNLQHPLARLSSMDSIAVIPASPWRRRLQNMLHSTAFEVVIVITILANSLLIGAEVQYAADYPDARTEVFINMNLAFTMIFLVELLARTWVDGLRRFWHGRDWAWNTFDLVIVMTSLAEVLTEVLTAAWASDITTTTVMRVFRIARAGKALRIQRLIRFISALRTLVFSIFVTLRSLVWALVLLLMIMYIFGIVITQFSVEHLHHGTDVYNPRLMKFWGSLWASMLTLFQSITGGISWHEVTDPLQEVSRTLVGVFIMYIFLITFAVFNVITGIFCHSAIETAVRDPDLAAQAELQNRKRYIQRVKKLFHDVDEGGSGVISLQDLESGVQDENVRAYFAALDLDLSDAWTIFKLIAGKNDVIDKDTFVKGCLRLRGSARRQDCIATLTEMEALLRRFSSFAKTTTQKMESLSAPGGLLRPQKPENSRISLWSQSMDSATQ